MRDERPTSLVWQFVRRFRNPLVLILVAASIASAMTGDLPSFAIIASAILLSVGLDFVQEHRAGRAAIRLSQSVALLANVVRDGTPKRVRATQIVPGDIVILAAGALVPADGVLVEARDLHVNEALLTGEPFPAEKNVAIPAAATDLVGATNALFMGTSVVSGTARLLVYRTGVATAMGGISRSLIAQAPPTAFDLGIRKFGMLIMRLTVLMVLFVLMVDAVQHKPLWESFLFAVALAVGLTPELLPMVVSVTLARGALRMADKHVMVKRLAAIENLGSMDVFCTDKTGTLTEAAIRLECHIDAFGQNSERVLSLAYLNSCFETGITSPLDDAIVAAHGNIERNSWIKLGEVPFDFERRRVSVLVDDGAARLLVVKGAPEDILRLSTRYASDAMPDGVPWDDASRQGAQTQLDRLCSDGVRVLGVAVRNMGRERDRVRAEDEVELVFIGFAGFLDPPKATAARAIAALVDSGVEIKILTGDGELVTKHVCAKLGLAVTGVVSGADVAQLDDQALQAQVERANLFCRVSPAQKNRIILALKRRQRVVGYLGDGINDAPALHSADVSLSVNSAVDVAKEAADIILLRRDLRVVHDGVIEGRRTFANIRKYIMMATSSNFGNMFSMAAASVFLPYLPMLPTQILLNNVLYDLSEVAIPLDHVDAEEIRDPQAWDMTFIRNFMWIIGPVSSLFDFVTFYVLLAVLKANEALFQTGWFVESLATQVLVIFVIRTRRNPLASRPHRALAATSVVVVVAALILPFTGLGQYFGFQPLPFEFLAILAVLVAAYLGIVEAAKRIFYRRVALGPK